MRQYQPKNDFGYTTFNEATPMPAMIGKFMNDSDGDDRYRLLCEGMAAVRTINEIAHLPGEERFVVMVVYITETLVAERYILFLSGENNKHVSQTSNWVTMR